MKNITKAACSAIGLELSDKQAAQFESYYETLLEWNKKINLTRITEPGEVAVKHFADSLTLFNFLEVKENARVIDVGTGAGFPGIPLKICRPDIELTLLDSLNKRLVFLSEACGNIGIEAKTIHSRAEDGGKNKLYREKYDLAVSRAVARLSTLSEYCLPYVRVGGVFAAMKGPKLGPELEAARDAIKALGGKIESVNEFELEGAGGRTIVIIKKIKPTPPRYPRQNAKIDWEKQAE